MVDLDLDNLANYFVELQLDRVYFLGLRFPIEKPLDDGKVVQAELCGGEEVIEGIVGRVHGFSLLSLDLQSR